MYLSGYTYMNKFEKKQNYIDTYNMCEWIYKLIQFLLYPWFKLGLYFFIIYDLKGVICIVDKVERKSLSQNCVNDLYIYIYISSFLVILNLFLIQFLFK